MVMVVMGLVWFDWWIGDDVRACVCKQKTKQNKNNNNKQLKEQQNKEPREKGKVVCSLEKQSNPQEA